MLVRLLVCLAFSQLLLCAGVRSICYNEMRTEFRCYDTAAPYTNTNGHLPVSPSQMNLQFLLYTNSNPTTAQTLNPMDANSIRNSHFDVNRDTKIIVHGFTDSGHKSWVVDMTRELLQKHVNVIAVDWAQGAAGPNYFQAAANTRVVGAEIATLILTAGSLGVTPSRFHIIGHSLGAHIAGYAGEKLHTLGRITGLDPAAPLFEGFDIRVKLNRGDAAFVDVIHTDAEPLIELGAGTDEMVGHVDFFPNGGRNQPGCPTDKFSWTNLLSGQINQLTDSIACSHNRATSYFTASINDNTFVSYPCASLTAYSAGTCQSCGSGCGNMGYLASPSLHGLYVLHTGAQYPY